MVARGGALAQRCRQADPCARLDFRGKWPRERARLNGTDTPETVAPRRPVRCFGRGGNGISRRGVSWRRFTALPRV